MSMCSKCNGEFGSSKEAITCAECKCSYHPMCTRIQTMDKFKKMSGTSKKNWKCDSCIGETSSQSSRSDAESSVNNAQIAGKIDDLVKSMSVQFQRVNQNFEEVKGQLTTMNSTVEGLTRSIESLGLENEARKKENEEMVIRNDRLEAEVRVLREEIRELQQRSRINNIEIVGVPLTEREDVYEILQRVAQVIKVQFFRSDFSIAHRLPLGKGKKYPTIIVQFVQRSVKALWLSAAKDNRKTLTAAELYNNFPSSFVFVNDHLTVPLKAALGRARHLVTEKKLAYAWSKDGKVLVRRDKDGPATRVWTPADVDAVIIKTTDS